MHREEERIILLVYESIYTTQLARLLPFGNHIIETLFPFPIFLLVYSESHFYECILLEERAGVQTFEIQKVKLGQNCCLSLTMMIELPFMNVIYQQV